MNTALLKIALRQNAIVIPNTWIIDENSLIMNETTSVLLANCTKLGFTFSEELLHKINMITPKSKLEILRLLKEVTGVHKNWTPLVKQWNIPTGETVVDHIVTLFANIFKSKSGTQLACGHTIPNHTFPLERYNGCPFCGTPFEFEELSYELGTNKLKTLKLWSEDDLQNYMLSLLASKVPLDATQIDSLTVLLANYDLPLNPDIGMKETLMVLVDLLVSQDKIDQAGKLFQTPNDVLRYLWFKHTGFLQLIEPKTIINRVSKNKVHFLMTNAKNSANKKKAIADLKLKYTRKESKIYATWLNNLSMNVEKQCEIMHPKRNMWVRVIRALRLAEYSKRKGFEKLANLLDVFYNQNYEVWQGSVNHFRLKSDADNTFKLLKQRPGLFARSLFSNMLWFGSETTIKHFKEIIDQVPARLVFTLNMYAETYFDKNSSRSVKPLGGTNKRIPAHSLLQLYSDDELKAMQKIIQELSLEMMKARFKSVKNKNKTMFIDKGLYNIPVAIGDRSESLQDLPSALMGTRFPVKGDTIRLFLQWGEGLPAQHLDMDLSCKVAYDARVEFCSYANLVITGCKHSGDIQRIPAKVGTAEYIDLDLQELSERGAKYVSFTSNAYTSGSLSPNLVVGWMDSKSPMKITSKGVAYNPSAVQHQVRIKQSLTKGMVFGILDVEKREVVWLEMSFSGQVVQNLDSKGTESFLQKLDAKLKIGDLLQLKAEMQDLRIVENKADADEVYEMDWALDSAEVMKTLLNEESY